METVSTPGVVPAPTRISWGSVIAGSIVAAALAAVLHGFGASIGLATSSSAPTWRDASVGLWILSGVYLMLVALASYGLGGYIAGWLKSFDASGRIVDDDEDVHSSLHGLLVWGLSTLLTLFILGGALALASRSSGPASNTTSSASSEALIAYDLDRLLRGDARGAPGDYARVRAETGRILLTAGGHNGVSTEDKQYLVRLVNAQINLAPADADRRVETAIVRANESISRARRSGVILGFMVSAGILLGLVAAWFAAPAGAKHGLDQSLVPIWGRRSKGAAIP
ncbi:MAG: hypothetical protein EOO38_08455 [Cytophagaceae bacterium]|nr:MAG: hypothetical protein EOO38_08455 [Cytophagaceae bacterium]